MAAIQLCDLEDTLLIQMIARGNPEPLGELYRRHGRALSCLVAAAKAGLRGHDVEDVCHEVMLIAYDKAGSFRGEGTVRSWLLGIARHKLRGLRRRQWQWREKIELDQGEDRAHTSGTPAVRVLEARERLKQTERALQTLPEGQREVLLLHALHDMSGAEIADALGLSVNTVWTRLFRARRTLDKELVASSESTPVREEVP